MPPRPAETKRPEATSTAGPWAVGAVRPAVKPRRLGAVSQSPASTGQRPLLTRGPPGPTPLSSCLRPHVTRFPVHRTGPRATVFVVPADPRHAARPRRRLRAAVLPDVRGCLTRSPGEGGRVQQTGRPAAALSVPDSAFSIGCFGGSCLQTLRRSQAPPSLSRPQPPPAAPFPLPALSPSSFPSSWHAGLLQRGLGGEQ